MVYCVVCTAGIAAPCLYRYLQSTTGTIRHFKQCIGFIAYRRQSLTHLIVVFWTQADFVQVTRSGAMVTYSYTENRNVGWERPPSLAVVCSNVVMRSGVHHAVFNSFRHSADGKASGTDCKGPAGLVRVPKRRRTTGADGYSRAGSNAPFVPSWAYTESWRWVHGPHASIDHRDLVSSLAAGGLFHTRGRTAQSREWDGQEG